MSHQEILLHRLHQQRTESHLCVPSSRSGMIYEMREFLRREEALGLEGKEAQTLDRAGRSQDGNTEQREASMDCRRREGKGSSVVFYVYVKKETMLYERERENKKRRMVGQNVLQS